MHFKIGFVIRVCSLITSQSSVKNALFVQFVTILIRLLSMVVSLGTTPNNPRILLCSQLLWKQTVGKLMSQINCLQLTLLLKSLVLTVKFPLMTNVLSLSLCLAVMSCPHSTKNQFIVC